jgi:hypothetical protein
VGGWERRRLRRALRGELDHIVMMALRKEPQRRYQSVEQLSADIRRYLENLPQTRGVQPPTYLPDGVRTQRLPVT